MNIQNLSDKIQLESSNYLRRFKSGLSKPVYKFINSGLNGMLRSKSIFVSQIATHLYEQIDKKKIEERLLYHLSKENMFNDLVSAYLRANTKNIREQKYIILDGSAIRKDYAEKMEGLAYIYDGAVMFKVKCFYRFVHNTPTHIILI